MTKPLNEFGGWLRVFFALNVAEIFACLILLILALLMLIQTKSLVSDGNFPLTEYIIVLILLTAIIVALVLTIFYVLVIIKTKASDIPTRICAATIFVFILYSIEEIIFVVFAHFNPSFPRQTGNLALSILCGAVWPLIWVLYFKTSSRVRLYYGANAFQKKANQQ